MGNDVVVETKVIYISVRSSERVVNPLAYTLYLLNENQHLTKLKK